MSNRIEGVSLFSVTPIAPDGSIDFDRWKRHLDDAIDSGVSNVTIFGSTGANGYFTETEKKAALDQVVRHVDRRVPIMFGIGAMTTDETVRLAKYGAANGASALLAIPLNYWRPLEDELIAHYEAVGAASDLPLWLYNNPPLAGIDLTPAIVARLSNIPSLVGMKDSSGDLNRVFTVPRVTCGKVMVGIGQDTLILEAALGMAPAWFTGLANVCPTECVAYWTAATTKDLPKALELAQKLYQLSELGSRYGIIRVAHTALDMLGRSVGAPRAPVRYLNGTASGELREALTRFGLLQ